MAVSTAATGRSAASERPEPEPDARAAARRSVAYRPLSPKLPVGLGALGGAAMIAGGLGVHLRVTRTLAEGQPPVEVLRVVGAAARPGWLLAIAGLVAGLAALAWRARPLAWSLVPVAASVLAIGLGIARLRFLDDRAAEIVGSETPSAEFVTFHAGFGWGAWFLLIGSILLALGVLAGALRAADVRRGLVA